MKRIFIILMLSVLSSYSYGYLGPGTGGGIIAAIVGFIAAIFLGLWAILYYPVKRALKNKKNHKNNDTNKNQNQKKKSKETSDIDDKERDK